MMKMNFIAGFVCVALLSACSSQKVATSEGAVTNTGTMNTSSTGNTGSGKDASSVIRAANADQPAAAVQVNQ